MFIIFRGEVIQLNEIVKGRWFSKDGTEFALRDESSSADKVDRCGIGVFSLPVNNPLNDDCARHDYTHVSSAYQAFHSRREADEYLKRLIEQEPSAWRFLAVPFYWICRIFGGAYWENPKTR